MEKYEQNKRLFMENSLKSDKFIQKCLLGD